MICRRYCYKCDSEVLHDKLSEDIRERCGTANRVWLAICTVGISEILRQEVWKCQKCGTEKPFY